MKDFMDIELSSELQEALDELLLHHSEFNHYKNMITKAFKFAVKAHEGVKRKSGEDYVMHPIRVAKIMNDMKADYKTICASLLHDTVEDVDWVTNELIASEFGTDIANKVDDVTKFSLNGATEDEELIRTINKIVSSILKDPASICIKLADRLDNMRTISGHKKPEKRILIAQQTLDVYVRLAEMLSMYNIKEDLEKLAFEVLQRDQGLTTLDELKKERYEKYQENDKIMSFIGKVTQTDMIPKILKEFDPKFNLLSSEPSKHIDFKFKSYYQINEKMKNLGLKSMSEIHDLIKIRINLKNVEDCYQAMKAIENYKAEGSNQLYFGKPLYFKDYISKPAFNGYQSIHVRYNIKSINQIVQFEYRTFQMKNKALNGIASCWNYDHDDATTNMKEFLSKLPFYEDLNELCNIYKNETMSKKKDQKAIELELYKGLETKIFAKRIKVDLDGKYYQVYNGCPFIELLSKKHPEYLSDGSIFERKGLYIKLTDSLKDEDVISRYVQEQDYPLQRVMTRKEV